MRSENLVLDASPLIILFKAELLSELSAVGTTWIIPESVCDEVGQKRSVDSVIEKIELNADVSRPAGANIDPLVASWDLGAGESAALTVALQTGDVVAVLDDLQARKAAKCLDVLVMGTLGLIVRAHKAGHLDSVEEGIQKVVDAGLYVGPNVIERVLRVANNGS